MLSGLSRQHELRFDLRHRHDLVFLRAKLLLALDHAEYLDPRIDVDLGRVRVA